MTTPSRDFAFLITLSIPASDRKRMVEPAPLAPRVDGMSQDALDFLGDSGRASRAAHRARFVIQQLQQFRPVDEEDQDVSLNLGADLIIHLKRDAAIEIAAWLKLDQVGIGGRKGVMGAATARIPMLQSVIANKHAQSGGAWDAAIQTALTAIQTELGIVRIEADGMITLNGEACGLAVCGLPALVLAPWLRALAARELMELGGRVLDSDVQDKARAWGESLDRWSNRLEFETAIPFEVGDSEAVFGSIQVDFAGGKIRCEPGRFAAGWGTYNNWRWQIYDTVGGGRQREEWGWEFPGWEAAPIPVYVPPTQEGVEYIDRVAADGDDSRVDPV